MTVFWKIACISLCLVSLFACENDMQAIMRLDQKAAVTEEGTKIESYYSHMEG